MERSLYTAQVQTSFPFYEERSFMESNISIHRKICTDMTELYAKKNADYGNSFAKLRSEYPAAICIRLQDKMNRLKSLVMDGNKQQVSDESIEDTLMDIANYAIMEIVERKMEKTKEEEEDADLPF